MRIAYDNFIDALSSGSMLASSYNTSYPLTNVQDQRLTVKWASDGATDQSAIFDLGSSVACSIFAILGHNISSACTVTVIGNNDIGTNLAWTTSGESSVQTITYNAGAMLSFVSPMTYRYWKFTFAGCDAGGIEVGRLWIGDYIDISPASLDDFTVTKKRDDIVVYGHNRQKYASVGHGWREFTLKFPRTKGTTLSAIQTLYDTVGNHSSFIFCNFDSLRTYELVEPVYCSISGEIGFSHSGRQFYTYGLTLEEDR